MNYEQARALKDAAKLSKDNDRILGKLIDRIVDLEKRVTELTELATSPRSAAELTAETAAIKRKSKGTSDAK